MSDPTKPAGTIYDIGYKRYVGTRRSVATRWLVIMRHQIAMGWKKWWRYKMPLFGAVVTTFVAAGLLYFRTTKVVRQVGSAGGGNDFAGMSVPSVWRHGRTAAAKVEALSSNGMDEIEIPAFLRKQAD